MGLLSSTAMVVYENTISRRWWKTESSKTEKFLGFLFHWLKVSNENLPRYGKSIGCVRFTLEGPEHSLVIWVCSTVTLHSVKDVKTFSTLPMGWEYWNQSTRSTTMNNPHNGLSIRIWAYLHAIPSNNPWLICSDAILCIQYSIWTKERHNTTLTDTCVFAAFFVLNQIGWLNLRLDWRIQAHNVLLRSRVVQSSPSFELRELQL